MPSALLHPCTVCTHLYEINIPLQIQIIKYIYDAYDQSIYINNDNDKEEDNTFKGDCENKMEIIRKFI